MAQPMFTFSVMGDKQVARGFSRFADDVKDLSEAFREIAEDFREGERRQFDTGGVYGAGGWAPLAPSTVAKKGHARILIDTETMRDSLTSKTPYSIEIVRPLELVVGTKVGYAQYHQAGRGVPARPIIALPEEQKTRWHKILQRHLVKQAKEAFR